MAVLATVAGLAIVAVEAVAVDEEHHEEEAAQHVVDDPERKADRKW